MIRNVGSQVGRALRCPPGCGAQGIARPTIDGSVIRNRCSVKMRTRGQAIGCPAVGFCGRHCSRSGLLEAFRPDPNPASIRFLPQKPKTVPIPIHGVIIICASRRHLVGRRCCAALIRAKRQLRPTRKKLRLAERRRKPSAFSLSAKPL